MKKNLFILIVLLIFTSCAQKTQNATSKFIKDYQIKYNIDEAIKIVSKTLKDKNYKIVSTFNHEKEALKLKEMLYPTKTINIYNPKISTKLIQCNPSMALEMPIRIALYNKIDGKTHISYTEPEYWSLKHNIKDSECLKLLIVIKNDLYDLRVALGAK